MPGLGGKRGKGKQAPKKGKAKRGSGNPAKRAAEEKAARERAAAGPAAPGGADGNPFGLPDGAQEEFDPSSLELPADLSKYLK